MHLCLKEVSKGKLAEEYNIWLPHVACYPVNSFLKISALNRKAFADILYIKGSYEMQELFPRILNGLQRTDFLHFSSELLESK